MRWFIIACWLSRKRVWYLHFDHVLDVVGCGYQLVVDFAHAPPQPTLTMTQHFLQANNMERLTCNIKVISCNEEEPDSRLMHVSKPLQQPIHLHPHLHLHLHPCLHLCPHLHLSKHLILATKLFNSLSVFQFHLGTDFQSASVKVYGSGEYDSRTQHHQLQGELLNISYIR